MCLLIVQDDFHLAIVIVHLISRQSLTSNNCLSQRSVLETTKEKQQVGKRCWIFIYQAMTPKGVKC
jgi:hypothetical protein